MSFSFQLQDLLHPGSDEDERLRKQRAAGAPQQPAQPPRGVPYRPPDQTSRYLTGMLPPWERQKAAPVPAPLAAKPRTPQPQPQPQPQPAETPAETKPVTPAPSATSPGVQTQGQPAKAPSQPGQTPPPAHPASTPAPDAASTPAATPPAAPPAKTTSPAPQPPAAKKAAAEKQQSPPQPAAPTSPPAAPTTAPSAQTPAAAPSAATTAAPTSPPAAAATPPAAPQPQPVRPMNRGEAAEARRLADAQKHGAVIKDGKTVPHPDGKGLLHHEGFVTVQTPAPHGRSPATQGPTTTIPYREDPDKGTTVPYRDDHGTHHQIPLNDITRVAGPDGKAEYHFMVGGKAVSVPEGQIPLFQVDKDGRRYTTAPDGTRRDLGADTRTMAQNGVAPREAAADKSLQEKLAQGAELQRQLQQKQAQAAAAQQRLDAAQQAVAAPFKDTGPESQTQRIHAQEEVIHAEAALKQQQQELQALQKQHDAHYSAIAQEQRARQAEIGRYQSAATASPHDDQWQKDSASMQGDPRATHLRLIAEAGKKDPASAESMRRALVPEHTQRLLAAAEKSFGGAQPPEGKSMTLHDMLMQAPEMTQGKDTRQTTVDQAAAARATAQNSLGITDPENVRVTRAADGSYSLSRPAADGTHQPFATLDPKTNRITLAPGPDGQLSQAAVDLAAKSAPDGTPVYLRGTEPPFSEAQVSDLIQKGVAATTSATDRKAADAALTQAGLSPEGIAQMVNEGRLSVQDGQLLNNKFNSGISSYAARDAAATGRQQDTALQQIYQSGKGTPDKPSFQSWMDKGDPRRDSQVRDMAQKMGVSEDAVRRDLETRRIMDWSTPLTQQSHDAQSGVGNAFMRGLGLGTAPEATRTLPDGTLMPNPMLGSDRAKFDAAIDAAQATPEAKAKAKELWGQYHDSYLTNARPALETMQTLPGVENYTAWRERMQKDGDFNHLTENQKAEQYMEEQKKRGSLVKILDTIGSNLIAGSHDLVSGIAGTAGLLTGSQTLSDFAAEKAGQANRSTAALQYTGSDGLLHNVIGGLSRALPGLAATAATGGTAGAATMAFVQGAGSTYTDLYQDGINKGLSPAEAHKAAAGPAIASGAVSAAIGKIMPGGTQALNNPATLEAAKKSFGTIVKSALQGAKDEVKEELIDSGFTHFVTEMSKGKTFQQAATSYAEQFPQSALTAALLGGGTEAASTLRKGGDHPPTQPATAPQQPVPANPPASSSPQQPGTAPQQPTSAEKPAPVNPPASSQQNSPSSPQNSIPDTTTQNSSGPVPQPSTTANDGKQPPTSPSGSGQQPPTTAGDSKPPPTPTASGSAQPPPTTANNSKQPPASPAPSLPPPTTAPKSPEQSQQLINNVMNRPPEQRGHPQVQSDVAQAQDVLKDHVQKLENQTEPLSNAQKKELADARATLSRLPADKPVNTPDSGPKTPPTDAARPEASNRPPADAPDSATRPHGEADPDAPPSAVDPTRTPQADTAPEAPLSRRDSDGWTPQANTHPNDARPGRKLPADAEPPPRGHDSSDSPSSGRNRPDARPLEPSHPTPERDSRTAGNDSDTTPYHPSTSADSANATTPQTADRPFNRNAPDQGQNTSANPSPRPTDNSRPPATNTPATPASAQANGSQPPFPSRSSLPPPRTPPLSVEQSQRLINNVADMSPEARQHPQVQADLAQARDVVAETYTKASESDFTSGSVFTNELPTGINSSSAYGATGINSRSSTAQYNSTRTEPSATSHVVGAGAYPTVRWNPNPEGTPVRTPEQAEAIAKEHGVHIPDWVKFRPVPSEFYGEDKWAQYCYFGPSTKHVSLKLLLDPDGTLSIGFDERLLHSDEGIVGIFAHEMHEVNALYEILRHGDSISFATLERLIQPPHGRLHQEAWNISDAKIKQMRKNEYDARTRKF